MITGKTIPLNARLVLIDIMLDAGVKSCEITSVARTPEEQARVMYENLIGPPPLQGIAAQRRLYLPPGNLIIDVFEQNASLPADQVQALMAAKIREIGPGTVSHHCCDPKVLTVFDIGPSSVTPQSNLTWFEGALMAAVADGRLSKFLSPHNADPALHCEMAVS
jgi:hypothetical protein